MRDSAELVAEGAQDENGGGFDTKHRVSEPDGLRAACPSSWCGSPKWSRP